MTESFRVGYLPGVTPTKWVRIWNERMPDSPLELVRTVPASQVTALHDGTIDVSFVRLPIDRDGLHAIPLYTEVPVVVVPKEHPIADVDSVTRADLTGETLLEHDERVEDAVELVAAGVGILLLPQSVARLHARRDVVHRPVTDAEPTEVALAWLADEPRSDIDEFVGIVRGRTARSSRSAPAEEDPPPARKTASTSSGAKQREGGPGDRAKRDRAKGDARKRAQARSPRNGRKPGKRR